MVVPVGMPSSSVRAFVFFKVLLLFWITWLVRNRLPVCVFVLLGRFPSCTEKTDRSIYCIIFKLVPEKKREREREEDVAVGKMKKYLFDLELGLQLCVHTADNTSFAD